MDTELKDHIDENIIHYCSLKQNPEYGIINQYFKEVGWRTKYLKIEILVRLKGPEAENG